MTIAERSPGRQALRPFEAGPDHIGSLDADVAATLIAAASDVALVVDGHGIIKDLSLGSDELLQEGLMAWVGRRLTDTVAPDSVEKVQDLVAEAVAAGPSRWRHVNHRLPRGSELPVRYSSLRVGDDRVVLIGRELRALSALQHRLTMAEQAMARDYQRIASAEGRYRMLFQTSLEAIAIADPATWRVLEANPAFAALIGRKQKDAVGVEMASLFDASTRSDIETVLAAVRLTARADDVRARLVGRDELYQLSATLFRQENAVRCLVRLVPTHQASPGRIALDDARILAVIEQMPEALVITGLDRRILLANPAFLDLAQVPVLDQARGQPLERWLGRTEVDVDVLVNAVREQGSLRRFATVVRSDLGDRTEVEVTAVALTQGDASCLGFTLRASGGRTATPDHGEADLPFSVTRLTDLIGQVSLKNLVRETTDEVERRCIVAALELTRNNRASAAEMLGLSRQSLYSKLRRHGLVSADEQEDVDE
jgi:transcriptional regulator PpsR